MAKDNQTIAMIDTYDRLPLGRYMDIVQISRDESLDDLDRQIAIISVLSGMGTEDILALDLASFSELSLRTSFLNREAKEGSVAGSYRLGKLELVRVKDFRSLTAGQYIDFQQYCKNGAEIVDLLSVILIPKGHRYNDGYDTDDVRKAIGDHLTLPEALALQGFFFRSSKELIDSSLSCWEAEIRRMPKAKRETVMAELERIRDSVPDGAGSTLSILSAIQRGKTGTRSSRWQQWSSFRLWLTGKRKTNMK